MKKKVCIVCLVVHFFALNMPAAYCQETKPLHGNEADSKQKYQEALWLYKHNKADDALLILDKLRRAYPRENRYLYDYVAIASGSGRHDLATSTEGLDLNIAPAYVLEALAASQRQLKAYESSLATYDLVARRFPERTETQVARVHTLIDALRYKEAEDQLLVLRKKHPDRLDVMECSLRLSDSMKPPVNTLREAEYILKIRPGNTFALRMRFYALSKLGAAHLAAQLTPQSILSEPEQAASERDRLAFELRWARISAGRHELESRWKEMDAVIIKLGETCRMAEGAGDVSEVNRSGCGDLVAALADRRRTPEAIALYEKMVKEQWDIQPYVQMAAAEAYLEERQPEIARSLYEASLQKDPNNFDARVGYIYALLESGRYADADRQAEKLAADTKEWISPESPEIRAPNPDYPLAQLTGALIRNYSNRLSEAEGRLQPLALRAPNNIEIRHALAMTYNLRGWPRRAENDLEWLFAVQPTNAWTKLGLFESRMAMGDFRGAEQQLDDAARLMPEEKSIQRAQYGWGTHNLRELVVESTFGNSNDVGVTPNGSQEAQIDVHLYAYPYNYNWRAFVHTQLARSTYPALSVGRDTMGGGAEYRTRDFSATGEILKMGNTAAGFALRGEYQLDDYWSINGLAENKSLSAPVRAYADGVGARNIQVGGGYRWHESRNVSLNASQMDFSDGNQRNAFDVSWMEGLLASATYTLESTVEYYASRNSSQSPLINYFNPVSDEQIGITLRNEWLQYHRYEKSLKHVLSIGVGNYAQSNFATGGVLNIKYELIHTHSDRLELRYGIVRTVHPYDGVRVTGNALTFGAGWRF